MAKINFNLRDVKCESKTPVNMVIRWNGLKLVYPTGLAILPIYWNHEQQKGKATQKNIGHPEFNESLTALKAIAEKSLRDFINDNQAAPTVVELRDKINNSLNRIERIVKTDLLGYITQFRSQAKFKINENTGKQFASKTQTAYKQLHDLLIEYSATTKKKIDFNDIDFEFYTDFVKFLTFNKTFAANTVGKHIKTLKTILNEATEAGINDNVKFRSKKFKVFNETADNIYLTDANLKELGQLDLSNDNRLERIRDLFLIGSYTGLRFSDFTNIKDSDIKGDFIEIATQKTGVKVAVPIHPVVRDIIEKYKGKFATPLPVPASNQKMNLYLKEICVKVPSLQVFEAVKENKGGMIISTNYQKFELVTTHTARRSFATNNFINGVPSQVIMKITGHKTESAFLKYIKITPTESAKIMQLYWEKSLNLKIS